MAPILVPPPGPDPADPTVPSRTGSRTGSRRFRWLAVGSTVLAVVTLSGAALVTLPVPGVDGYVRGKVVSQVSARMASTACPGRAAPTVQVPGRALLRSVLADRLPELRIIASDVAVGGAEHARVETVARDLRDLRSKTPTAGRLTTTVSIAYDDLPAPQDGPAADLSLADDGRLRLSLTTPAEQADRTTSRLKLALSFGRGTVLAVPREFRIFGRTVPLENVKALTGGTRVTRLPALPTGLRYTAVSAQDDGIHVSLDGVVVTPLRTLPTRVDGRTISYTAGRGLLGLSTSQDILGLYDLPLTIWTRPRLAPGRLVLEPVSVEILGEDRPTGDPLARTVLEQTDRSTLGRALPALPRGVRYRFAKVDAEGIKVGVAGTTVRPFSSLPAPTPGARTVFGAEKGMLTVTTTGVPDGQDPLPLELLVRSGIEGDRLVLTPQVVRLLGVEFPPAAVFDATGGAPDTTFPLAPLAKGLAYSGVEATPTGLRFTVTGRDLALTPDLLGSDGCGTDRSSGTTG